MSDDAAAELSRRIEAHLEAHPIEGVALTLDEVVVREGGFDVAFVTDAPMRMGDHRIPDAVNEALRASVSLDARFRGAKIEVRVDTRV
jgi:hypothetical protein